MMNNENELSVVSIKLVREPSLKSNKNITSVEDAIDVINEFLTDCDRELFCVLNLKSNGDVINMNVVSQGTLDSSIVSPREVFKSAILSNAKSMLVFHNHPSGSLKPSRDDYNITKRLVECGELLDIPIIDHIIMGAGKSRGYSFLANEELGKSYNEVLRKQSSYER